MKERPIIFSGQMVQAILDGKKTQTRRVLKPQPTFDADGKSMVIYVQSGGGWLCGIEDAIKNNLCSYGQVGDRLWVRETFVLESTRGYTDEISVGALIEQNIPHKIADGDVPDDDSYLLIPHYRATEPKADIVPEDTDDDYTRWHPSIFMPRWASRITLEITKIRVERLQDINKKDKYGQSLVGDAWTEGFRTPNPTAAFIVYWNSLSAKRGYGWDKNPWVWVIEFKKSGEVKND